MKFTAKISIADIHEDEMESREGIWYPSVVDTAEFPLRVPASKKLISRAEPVPKTTLQATTEFVSRQTVQSRRQHERHVVSGLSSLPAPSLTAPQVQQSVSL